MLGRFFDSKIRRIKRITAGLLARADDRSQLLALELATEARWLARLCALALGATIVVVICLVWLMATLVALSWDTPWRFHALGAASAFWLVLCIGLLLKIRSMLRSHPSPFPLSRRVFADDLQSLRGEIDHE